MKTYTSKMLSIIRTITSLVLVLMACNILIQLAYQFSCPKQSEILNDKVTEINEWKQAVQDTDQGELVSMEDGTFTTDSIDLISRFTLTTRAAVPGIGNESSSYRCKQFAKPFPDWMYDQETALNNTVAFYKHFKPKEEVVTNIDFDFIIRGAGICRGTGDPLVVIIVMSAISEADNRMAIRRSWGHYACTGDWSSNQDRFSKIKVVFFFGRGKTSSENSIIRREQKLYGDIVQVDMIEAHNQTKKVLMGLRWASLFCSNSKYVMKVVSETFVHIPNLVKLLRSTNLTEIQSCGLVVGYMDFKVPVLRYTKWAVLRERYPLEYYPSYVTGNIYIITTDVTASMFQVSKHIPLFEIENAFITGVLRSVLALNWFSYTGFTLGGEDASFPCAFKTSFRITANMNPSQMTTLWQKISNNTFEC